MSVINNVLKDLEARESRFAPIGVTAVDTPMPRARRDLKMVTLVLIPLLVVIAAGWFFYTPSLSSSQSLAQTTSNEPAAREIPIVAAASIPATVQPAAVTHGLADAITAVNKLPKSGAQLVETAGVTDRMIGNQIVGLQIRESEQTMRLEFVLRDRVIAYLRNRGVNRFAYHLRDIESQIVAPAISDNPWLEALVIRASDSGVDIEFETAPNILVESGQNQADGEPIWAISLRHAQSQSAQSGGDVVAPVAVVTPAPLAGTRPEAAVPADAAAAAASELTLQSSSRPAAEVKLEIKATDPNAKVANRLEYATQLMNSRRHTDAQNLLLELIGGVEDYQARKLLLALYQGKGFSRRFERLAHESALAYPGDAVFTTEYARVLFQRGAYRAVIESLVDATVLDAKQQSLVAASYQRLDEHDSAIRHYELALQQDAANAKNWVGLGISQEHSARLEAALDSYRRAGRLGQLSNRLQAFVDQRSRTLMRVIN